MMRSSDAPKETSKHLGHGICDNISKSRVLANPTCDLAVIKREVGHLLQEMKLDHSDMRGLGIQISKLDGNTKGVAAGTSRASTSRGGGGGGGASILSFVQKINPPPKKKMKAETTVPPPIPSTSAAAAAAAESDLTDVSSSSHRQSDLSFSQLDPEVMDALPEDIRREVLEGLEHSKKKPESSGCNKVSQDMLSNRASTSVAGAEATASGQDISSAGAELSFSQLDPEFLAALPPDLVAEVKQQYTKPTTRQQQRQTVTAFDRMMEKKPPPASATTSPVTSRKRGRGRPPKNSPRFIKKSSNRSNPNSPAKKRPVSRALFDPPKAAAAEERTPAAATSSAPAPAVVEVREPANIEGRREPSEVRKLLKAWMESTENPTEDDVATFAKFLQELIEEKAIDIVSVILKSFCRFLGTKKQKAEHWWDSSWKAAYEKIEEHVQLSMIANYEYKMFTDFKI